MSARRLNSLWLAIDVLETQEHLGLIRAVVYPNLKESARAERDKALNSIAYPRNLYPREAKSVGFLVEKLGGKNGRRK